MKRLISFFVLAVGLLAAGAVSAAEQAVTLAVANMTCAMCEPIVRKTLSAVPGVSKVVVSAEKGSAVVTFDDEKTSIQVLVDAVTKAGYPTKVAAVPEAGAVAQSDTSQSRHGSMMSGGMMGRGMMGCPMMSGDMMGRKG